MKIVKEVSNYIKTISCPSTFRERNELTMEVNKAGISIGYDELKEVLDQLAATGKVCYSSKLVYFCSEVGNGEYKMVERVYFNRSI